MHTRYKMTTKYKIKEIYFTLQGEGYHTGRPAIFCRFTGCNLWSGREEDRQNAICQFCDTDFVGMDGRGGGSYTLNELIDRLSQLWPEYDDKPFVVFTGGEPLLQFDQYLLDALINHHFEVAIETNGTIIPDFNTSAVWLTVSPKMGSRLRITTGDELKLVYPQLDCKPCQFETLTFDHFYLQPLDNEALDDHIATCLQYCLDHPKWKLSLQRHKILGIK